MAEPITPITDADESPGFRAFCNEGDCVWSSHSTDTADQALGVIEGHLKDVHDITDTKNAKFDIEELSP